MRGIMNKKMSLSALFRFCLVGLSAYPLIRGCPSCEVLLRGAITADGMRLFMGDLSEPLRAFPLGVPAASAHFRSPICIPRDWAAALATS